MTVQPAPRAALNAAAINSAAMPRPPIAGERGELTSAVRPTVLANVFLVHVLTATLAWSYRPRPRLAAALGDATEIFLNGARAPRR